jgi:hypothetical protein
MTPLDDTRNGATTPETDVLRKAGATDDPTPSMYISGFAKRCASRGVAVGCGRYAT